ncbi:MAG: ABC transporter substrate-binding protein [Xenococcaceae cyanobacterium MO_207.B15]|nr:ABC transporter substrate-binding protein [Xenococcaceae cyanobacterium MO_207.B15]
MLNKQKYLTKRNFLLFLYIVLLSLFGPLLYWLNTGAVKAPWQKTADKNNIEKRISSGKKILVTADNSIEKQAGVTAFADGDYGTALAKFESALKNDRNDPESLIYRNNAIAIASNNTYKIGVSVPIGGNLGVAKEILRGVAQAQDEINQSGGINGNLVLVEIANDDNDPEIAQKIATEFVKDKKVLAVIGHNDSNASMNAAPIYQNGGLVMITPTSSADSIPSTGNYIFRTTPSSRVLADTIADYGVNVAGKEKFVVCMDSESEVSKSFQKEFTWAAYNYGGTVLPTKCDFSAPDFLARNIPSRAISAGADALLLAPSVRNIHKAIDVAKVNDDRLTLFGNHSMNNYMTLKRGQIDVNGMVSVVAWHPDEEMNNSFISNAQKLWGGAVGWRTAMAYDATQTAFTAIKMASSNRKELQQAMINPNFVAEGGTEEIRFFPSGDRKMKGTAIQVQPGNLSGTGYDFVLLNFKSSPTNATKNPQ